MTDGPLAVESHWHLVISTHLRTVSAHFPKPKQKKNKKAAWMEVMRFIRQQTQLQRRQHICLHGTDPYEEIEHKYCNFIRGNIAIVWTGRAFPHWYCPGRVWLHYWTQLTELRHPRSFFSHNNTRQDRLEVYPRSVYQDWMNKRTAWHRNIFLYGGLDLNK